MLLYEHPELIYYLFFFSGDSNWNKVLDLISDDDLKAELETAMRKKGNGVQR